MIQKLSANALNGRHLAKHKNFIALNKILIRH
jgi:hypothetical protein